MKRKYWICAALVLLVLLGALARLTRDSRDTHTACAWLQSQKYDESDPEAAPRRIDPTSSGPAGQVASMQVNSNCNIDLLISCVKQAEEVRRVDAIPELSSPLVSCGECLRGNWERLYYTDPASRRITEFTLTQADSMTLALCLVPYGPIYPEIQELYVTELAEELQSRLPEAGKDQFELDENGYLTSVNIRTQETLDRYLDCIRNSISVRDYSDVLCWPWLQWPYIQVAGKDVGDCEYADYISPSTGRPIVLGIPAENSRGFMDYLVALAQAKPYPVEETAE